MRAASIKYSAPIGIAIWAITGGLFCTQANCSITIEKLPEIFAVAAGFVVATVAILTFLPQANKLLRLPTVVLATVYFVSTSYLTVNGYTPKSAAQEGFYLSWLFWTALGVIYALSTDKINTTSNNGYYKFIRALVWIILIVAALFSFSAWIFLLYILVQVMATIASIIGWHFLLWLKENFSQSTE